MSDSQTDRLPSREEVERISQLLQRFIKHLRSHDRSELTIKSYSSDLTLFARWFYETNREELTPQYSTPSDLTEYKRYLLEDRGFKPATVNRRLASISAFCKWAEEQGIADGNPCDEISMVPEVRTAPKWLTKTDHIATFFGIGMIPRCGQGFQEGCCFGKASLLRHMQNCGEDLTSRIRFDSPLTSVVERRCSMNRWWSPEIR